MLFTVFIGIVLYGHEYAILYKNGSPPYAYSCLIVKLETMQVLPRGSPYEPHTK